MQWVKLVKRKKFQHLKEAENLIESHTFPDEVADREARQKAFLQRWNEALFEVQLQENKLGAIRTAQKFSVTDQAEKALAVLESYDYENLRSIENPEVWGLVKIENLKSYKQKLRYLKLLSQFDPRKFLQAILYSLKDLKIVPSDSFKIAYLVKCCLLLIEFFLKREEYNDADQYIKEVDRLLKHLMRSPQDKNARLKFKKKLQDLINWPRVPVQRRWFSWSS